VINKHKLWSRVFTYIPTPTANDGESIDENALRQVIDYQVEMRVDGICVLGSTGSNGSFADEEMKRITEVASRHAGGRIPVIAGTGARTTTACIRLSKHAQEVGCDGVMFCQFPTGH
jgi:4-hydroxy-tetrahydrodipicolinate synthase